MLGELALSFERKHSIRTTSVTAVTFPDNLLRHAGVVTQAVLVAEHRIHGPQLVVAGISRTKTIDSKLCTVHFSTSTSTQRF
jgi:hypothetical protein